MANVLTPLELLEKRKRVHLLMDALWKSGACDRDTVYAALTNTLHTQETAHISTTSAEDLERIEKILLDAYEASGLYKCRCCRYRADDDTCDLTKKNRFEELASSLEMCKNFKERGSENGF